MTRWTSVHLDDIPKRHNGWIPIRDHLGIEAFGVNAWTKRDSDGRLIGPHNELDTQHEELYYVYRGHAVFTIGEDEVDAPEGTIVFVKDPSLTRGADPKSDDTIVFTAGGRPGEAFTVSTWELNSEWNQRAFPLYNEQRYEEAAAILREGLAAGFDNPGMHYNLACFEALAGNKDAAIEHLRKSFEGDASFPELAKNDSDLDSLRDDPRYPS